MVAQAMRAAPRRRAVRAGACRGPSSPRALRRRSPRASTRAGAASARAPKFPSPVEPLLPARAGAATATEDAARDAGRHPRPHGARRHPRPARRRLPPLLDRRARGWSRTSRRCSTTTRPSRGSTPRRAPLAPEAGFARVARDTLDFVLARDDGPEAGGFLSAHRRRDRRPRGRLLHLDRGRARRALPGKDGELFRAASTASTGGPTSRPTATCCTCRRPRRAGRGAGVTDAELLKTVEAQRRALLGRAPRARAAARRRQGPRRLERADDRRDGARGRRCCGEPRYPRAAERAAASCSRRCGTRRGTLLHTWRGGTGRASRRSSTTTRSWSRACSTSTRRRGEQRWLDEAVTARRGAGAAARRPATAATSPRARIRSCWCASKPAYDGAVASGNGVAAANAVELARRTGDAAHRRDVPRGRCAPSHRR